VSDFFPQTPMPTLFAPMKRPTSKATPASARFRCGFPGCEKRFCSTDGVRKHARKRHTEWLRNVDQHAISRDKAFASKPSTYCVMECDEGEDEDEYVSDVGSSWRSSEDLGASENEDTNVEPEVAVVKPLAVDREPTRLASIAMEMNAEALMPTRLPSVPDFVRLLAGPPLPSLPSDDDEPHTPPYSPSRGMHVDLYATPVSKGVMSGPILPFFLDDGKIADRGPQESIRATGSIKEDTDPDETLPLNPAECDAWVSTLLAGI